MLWEEMKKYTELTGEDATHVPIIKIGAYLDGYEKGTEVIDKIRAEIIENSIEDYKYHGCGTDELIIETSDVLHILDKYKAESEE